MYIKTPVYKKKCKINYPSSYWPVALVSVMSKVLKHVLKSRGINFLEHYNVSHGDQHGFQDWRSINTLLNNFLEEILDALEDKELLVADLL